jgi:predicted DCC family thiol-disulfide oxidoreductase YuxK
LNAPNFDYAELMKSKIFFDGNCVVCDAEISHYKRIAPADFELLDISDPGFDASEYGFDPENVNRQLHVMGPDQKVYIGVAAFQHIWSRIPKYRWLSGVVAWPGIQTAAQVGYHVFVRIRPYLPKKTTLAAT